MTGTRERETGNTRVQSNRTAFSVECTLPRGACRSPVESRANSRQFDNDGKRKRVVVNGPGFAYSIDAQSQIDRNNHQAVSFLEGGVLVGSAHVEKKLLHIGMARRGGKRNAGLGPGGHAHAARADNGKREKQ